MPNSDALAAAPAALIAGPGKERFGTTKDRTAESGGDAVKRSREVDRVIALVSREELVASVAGERDRNEIARELREVIGGHGGRVGVRLAVVSHEVGEDREQVGTDDELVMLGPEPLGDAATVPDLGVVALVETDRERPHDGRLRRHARDEDARVDL